MLLNFRALIIWVVLPQERHGIRHASVIASGELRTLVLTQVAIQEVLGDAELEKQYERMEGVEGVRS